MDEKIHTWVCDIVDENAPMTVDRNEAMVTMVVVTVDGNTRKQSQKKKNKERKQNVQVFVSYLNHVVQLHLYQISHLTKQLLMLLAKCIPQLNLQAIREKVIHIG